MVVGVIPARLESTRFPRKILFPINNRPMIVRVYERALQVIKLNKILVAVDSDLTSEVLKEYGIDSIKTSIEHKSGTDRIAEAIKNIKADIIINIQADEPMIDPIYVDELITAFEDKKVKMATLASTAINNEDLKNPNAVKITIGENKDATGFYRNIENEDHAYLRHIGIYGYRKNILLKLTQLPQSENEKKYKLEQLRALDNGIPIRVVECDYKYHGIDSPDDLKQFNE